MNDYLKTLSTEKNQFLTELRQHAESDNVPILRADAAALMRVLTTLKAPQRILEAGTAVGYSAILMATCCSDVDGKCGVNIDTVELDIDTAAIAKENIKKAGLEKNIRVIVGDAGEVLSCLSGSEVYDMIFVDSAKSQYIEMYDDIKRLLKPGGLLVCDNVIFYGKIFDAPEDAPHKHRTIIANLRAFLEKLTSDDDYTTSVIETGDGMTISVKRKD
ncbi:MAG: O-methyltransferase [Ruminococcaceae bacterium]|nr:O-methyltransferase [Oscillospiraceae bacterium]